MIRESTNVVQWFYVESNSNPADHASRGLTTAALQQSSLYTGPDFLLSPDFESLSIVTVNKEINSPQHSSGGIKGSSHLVTAIEVLQLARVSSS